jgi:hypothetical protein
VGTPKTAGKRLILALNAAISDDEEWTEAEKVTLGLLEEAADRLKVLKRLFDAEVDKEPVSTRRVTELSAEIRQHELNIQKWVGSLDLDMERLKSARHVHAANVRWLRAAT